MIPTAYWTLAVGLLLGLSLGWWVGRGRLRDERTQRMAAEADAHEGAFAAGRAGVQTATVDALTRTLVAGAAGSDLPPRDAGITEPTLLVPPLVAMDATLLAADHPPPAATSLAAVPPGLDWAGVHDVYPTVDDPPQRPHLPAPPGDDPAAPEPDWERDDEDGPDGPSTVAEVVAVTDPPKPSYRWSWEPGSPPPLTGAPMPGVLPAGWMLRASRHARARGAAVYLQAPIAVQRLARHVAALETVTGLRTGLADFRTGMDRWWEQWQAGQNPDPVGMPRLPQSLPIPPSRHKPVAAVVDYRAGGKRRGRHRVGVAAGSDGQRVSP
jgi:hypothetical protein